MNANYNYIINLLTEIANGHPQLQDVRLSFQDQRSLFHEKAKGLPVLYANVTNVRYLEYTVNWDIDIYIMDNMLDNRENESSIMNNTGEIVNHIINFVKNEKFNDYRFLDIGFAQPLNNYDNNRMNGWIFRTRIETKREQCYTPIEGGVVPILCADANVIVLNSDNIEVDSGTVGSGATGTFLAPDADAVLKNTTGATLSTTSIASGDSEDIVAPDANLSINGQPTYVIPSGGFINELVENTQGAPVGAFDPNSASWVVGDAGYTLDNSEGSTLLSGSIPAEDAETIIAPDGVASNSNASFTLSVPSGGTAPIPDSQINVNGVNEGDVVSVQPINITLTDGTNPVTPESVTVVGNDVEVEVVAGAAPIGAMLLKSGGDISYISGDDGDLQEGRNDSFFLLDSTKDPNPFGNYQRFTGITGGYYDQALSDYFDKDGVSTTYALAFPSGIMIDWTTFGDKVLGYALESYFLGLWADIKNEYDAATYGGFAGWRMFTLREIDNLKIYAANIGINFKPITDSSLVLTSRYHTLNTRSSSLAWNITLSSLALSSDSLSATRAGMAVRYFTVSGTTLT